jgi:hypothetical protein
MERPSSSDPARLDLANIELVEDECFGAALEGWE